MQGEGLTKGIFLLEGSFLFALLNSLKQLITVMLDLHVTNS